MYHTVANYIISLLFLCENSLQLTKLNPIDFKCHLDNKISPSTIADYNEDIGSMFGDACGRNRGIFVLMPGDGQTYNCGKFPEDWSIPDAGSLLQTTNKDNAVSALNSYLSANYNTSIVKTADSCGFNGVSQITCGRELPWKTAPWYHLLHAPIRSVNIGGLFVLERWILPSFAPWGSDTGIIDQYTFSQKCGALGICNDLYNHWDSFYSESDFTDMKNLGLNSVRLPIGYWYFSSSVGLDPAPYLVPEEDVMLDMTHPISKIIQYASNAGLKVILDLHGAPGSQNGLDNSGQADSSENYQYWGQGWLYNDNNVEDTIKILVQISRYCALFPDTVIALELLNEPWSMLDIGLVSSFYMQSIEEIRIASPSLPLITHDSFRATSWSQLLVKFKEDDVFLDVHIYHGFNPADIASDSPTDDRTKMTTHQSMSCGYGNYLKFVTCDALPVFVGEWSLAIDDCMPEINPRKMDFGQCNYLKGGNGGTRMNDTWWFQHIQDFASRQISVFEQLLGWSFWTYKLDDYAESSVDYAPDGVPLWSFKTATRIGLINTALWNNNDDEMLFQGACDHQPEMKNEQEDVKDGESLLVHDNFSIILAACLFPAAILFATVIVRKYPLYSKYFSKRRHYTSLNTTTRHSVN